MSLKETLQTFSSANVRRLYLGGFCIFLGFWLTFLSLIWLVFQLTNSSFMLGVMGLVLTLPIFLLLPFAGVLADRISKLKILIVCATGFLITPAILAWVTWRSHVSILLLIIVSTFYGALYAVMNPSVNAYIKEVVERREDVHRVTGMLSSNTKIAQLFAAALNGLLHLFFTISSVFIAAFIAHFISLFAFSGIKNVKEEKRAEYDHPLRQFYTGMQYTFSYSPFWSVLMLASTGSLIVLAWQWQLPVFAGHILGGDSKTLSQLFFVGGIGGISGGIYASLRQKSSGLMRLAVVASSMIALGLIGFSFSRNRLLSMVFAFFIDGGWVILLATTSSTLQLLVDDNKRGRVMSFYAMGVFGLMPFTNFFIAALCTWLGVQWGIFSVAILCALITLFYGTTMALYRRKLLSLYKTRSLVRSEWPI